MPGRGTIQACRLFGVVAAAPPPRWSQRHRADSRVPSAVSRGVAPYALTGCAGLLDAFLASCRKWEESVRLWEPFGDLASARLSAERLQEAVLAIKRETPLSGEEYCSDSVAQTLLLARAHWSPIDWSQLFVRDLGLFCPALGALLQDLPQSWSAQEASAVFLGRPDVPLLLPVLGSLWKATQANSGVRPKDLLALVGGVNFGAALAKLKRDTGTSPSPAACVRLCLGK